MNFTNCLGTHVGVNFRTSGKVASIFSNVDRTDACIYLLLIQMCLMASILKAEGVDSDEIFHFMNGRHVLFKKKFLTRENSVCVLSITFCSNSQNVASETSQNVL